MPTISKSSISSRIVNSSIMMGAFRDSAVKGSALTEIRPQYSLTGSVHRYSLAFAESIATDPDMTMRDMLASMKDPSVEGLKNSIVAAQSGELIRLDSSGTLRKNPAYQGLAWLIRCLPKTDCHVHISNNLHESEIAEITGESTSQVKAKVEENDDYYITSYEILQNVIETTCQRFFEDGVESFNIRLNPLKEYSGKKGKDKPSEEEWKIITRRFMNVVENGIKTAVVEAKEKGFLPLNYEDSVGIVFSFNRGKPANGDFLIHELGKFALEACKNNGRLKGVDISGSEISAKREGEPGREKLDPQKWNLVIETAKEMGIFVTTHLDFRISRSSPDIIEKLKSFRGLNRIREMLEIYVPFAQDFIDILPPGSGIGHGYILYPEYLITPLWDSGVLGINIGSTEIPIELQDAIIALRETAADKVLHIEHNPCAAFRHHLDINMYSRSMIYGFPENRIPLKIGTDAGIYSMSRPRVLSEEIARLLISAPPESKITFRQMLGFSGCEIV